MVGESMASRWKGVVRVRPYEEEGEVGWARGEMGQVGEREVGQMMGFGQVRIFSLVFISLFNSFLFLYFKTK